ncbi:MAG: hypothetical protein V8S96_05930 [Lachnospiraceae bacterium]
MKLPAMIGVLPELGVTDMPVCRSQTTSMALRLMGVFTFTMELLSSPQRAPG